MREKIAHRTWRHPPKPNRKMQIRGQEQKNLMAALDEATGKGEIDIPRDRIERRIDQAAENAGLTKTQ